MFLFKNIYCEHFPKPIKICNGRQILGKKGSTYKLLTDYCAAIMKGKIPKKWNEIELTFEHWTIACCNYKQQYSQMYAVLVKLS